MNGERKRRNEGRKTNRQADSQVHRTRVLLAIRALDETQGPSAPRRLLQRWLTRGPLICDPDPPYLNNPGYGFHLSSQDAHPHPRTLTYIHEESLRGTCRRKGGRTKGARGDRSEGLRRGKPACTHPFSLSLSLGLSPSRLSSQEGTFYRIRNSTVRVQPIIWFIPEKRVCVYVCICVYVP